MARIRSRLRLEPLTVFGMPTAGPVGAGLIPITGQQWFVDPNADVAPWKKAFGTGKAEDRPFETLEEGLDACNTGDTIFITGNIREEGLICSNLKFDVKVVGVGSQHHPDQPTSAYHPGSACIRPPASPTATTPLISVRGRGWQFHNIMFDCPVDEAGLKFVRNSSSTTAEYDAGHGLVFNCDFRSGLNGVWSFDGIFNMTIRECVFESLTGSAILDSINTGVAAPRRWRILDNFFQPKSSTVGNANHISAALNGSLIKGNVFGTVESTGKYINLAPSGTGAGNVICYNVFAGAYDTSDYLFGTGDVVYQNACAVEATEAPDGVTILPPAGP